MSCRERNHSGRVKTPQEPVSVKTKASSYLAQSKPQAASLVSSRSGSRKALDGRRVGRRTWGFITKLLLETVAIAQPLECLPGTHKTLGFRPIITALKRQRQEGLEINAILKQFEASLGYLNSSFKGGRVGLPLHNSAQNLSRILPEFYLKLNSC